MKPQVTIIVPIYGVERYIERCARALFEQTLDNIQYVFVDDCTNDRSMDILDSVLKEYPKRIPQCTFVKHDVNKGLPTARKSGISVSKGEYIAHCDSDDWPESAMYETLYNTAKANDADIVYCDFYRSSSELDKQVVSQYEDPYKMHGPVWNKIVRRSIYENNEILYPIHNKAEDSALMMMLSFYATSAVHVTKPLYNYFYNPDSICRVETQESCVKRFVEEKENTDLRILFLETKGVLAQYKYDIYRWKILTKKNLVPLLNDKHYRLMWRNTYSEMNIPYLLDTKVSIRRKISYVAAYFGIYNIVKTVIGDCL